VQWVTNRIEELRKRPWPDCEQGSTSERNTIAAVTVNYNTVDITRQMLYSVFNSGAIATIDELVVVDNGSTDGSRLYLDAMAARGLITLLTNRWPPYHGPGLNRAMSHLARQGGACAIEYVWILDTDVIVLRGDTLQAAIDVARAENAAIVGQHRHGDSHSLFAQLVDPKQIWRRSTTPFQDSGSPSKRLEYSVLANGGTAATFGFAWRGDVVHLESATSQQLLRIGKDRNPYAQWIGGRKSREGSPDYDFESIPNAADRYFEFLETYRANAEALAPDAFADLLERMRISARRGDAADP
jgi:hypothetical protein